MSTTGRVHRVPAGAPGGSSPAVAGRSPAIPGAHHRSGSGLRWTTVPSRSSTPVASSAASAVKTASEPAAQRRTASAGAAR